MDIDSLMAKINEYLPADGEGLIKAAYEFAAQAHKGQMRKSGEPYLEHPLQVTMALANLHLDRDTLIAALLHDILEDCDVSLDEIEVKFGSEVAKLVDGVTKLKKITNRSEEGWGKSGVRAENLRKMLVATVEDLRVIIILKVNTRSSREKRTCDP